MIVSKTAGTRTTVSMLIMILLLQAVAAVQTSLLIRSGDVETNPGPGELHCMVKYLLAPTYVFCTISDLDYDAVDGSTVLSEFPS